MPYTPQTWSDSPATSSPIDATRLNYMEAGIAAAATLASPALTGTPTAPTATAGDVSTQLANDAFIFANTRMVANVKAAAYGAVADGTLNVAGDGHITSGLNVLTSASGVFAAGDVGKYIEVAGAGTAGAFLVTTISAYTSATSVTLTAAAATTVTTSAYTYGTDNTTAIQAAINAAVASPFSACWVPSGIYITGPLTIPSGVNFVGVVGIAVSSAPTAEVSRLILKKGSSSGLIQPNDTSQFSTGVVISRLLLDTNMVAQSAINIPDQSSAPGARYWTMDHLMLLNSGFSSGTPGGHLYVGHNNNACIVRDSVGRSNAALVTTQGAYGDKGLWWYGNDGLAENNFFGNYGTVSLYATGGGSPITLLVVGGGYFWAGSGVVIGAEGVTLIGVSIDHNYNDGIYAGYDFTAVGCEFHGNSIQTTNQWAHVNLAAGVTGTLVGCHALPRDGDTGNSNNPAYFVNASAAGAVFNDVGNFPSGSPVFGTGWTNYTNTFTAVSNAVTVTTSPQSQFATVQNNAAGSMAITLSTALANPGQKLIVSILDHSGVAQTLSWVNTENSTVSAPTTSNGSTTLPLTVEFIYNGATSKWRCVASA